MTIIAYLTLYTIYENPRDYPGKFVVREHIVAGGCNRAGQLLGVVDTLEEARKRVPVGRVNLHRELNDEPQIVETWI